ncbi:MAG TPA: hypothetical protein VFP53_06005 [Sphingomicrobium sp.]|nr:hypothetical protein [Sphingomicrobium sp.]
MHEIAIRILGGGPDDLIMVPAMLVGFNMYRLLDFSPPPNLELDFGPGDLVTTIPLPDSNGNDVLFAHRLFIK